MKKIILNLLLAVFSLITIESCQKNFSLEGKLEDDVPISKFYVYVGNQEFNERPILLDSIDIKDNKFSFTSGELDLKPIFLLPSDDAGNVNIESYVSLFAINGENVNLTIKKIGFDIDGGMFYHQYHNLLAKITEAQEKYFNIEDRLLSDTNVMYEIGAKFREEIDDYVVAHKDEEGTLINALLIGVAPDYATENISSEISNGRFKTFLETIKKAREIEEATQQAQNANLPTNDTSEGQPFVDFEVEYDGKVQHFSDYIGKGKYVLVDFWASWCGPCRGEIPNLIAVYNKYKGNNFDVLGVTVNDKPEESIKIIQQMKIPYSQMLNAQDVGAMAYNITAIPEIILFSPDGTILKRGLRGSAVEEAVKQYVK